MIFNFAISYDLTSSGMSRVINTVYLLLEKYVNRI